MAPLTKEQILSPEPRDAVLQNLSRGPRSCSPSLQTHSRPMDGPGSKQCTRSSRSSPVKPVPLALQESSKSYKSSASPPGSKQRRRSSPVKPVPLALPLSDEEDMPQPLASRTRSHHPPLKRALMSHEFAGRKRQSGSSIVSPSKTSRWSWYASDLEDATSNSGASSSTSECYCYCYYYGLLPSWCADITLTPSDMYICFCYPIFVGIGVNLLAVLLLSSFCGNWCQFACCDESLCLVRDDEDKKPDNYILMSGVDYAAESASSSSLRGDHEDDLQMSAVIDEHRKKFPVRIFLIYSIFERLKTRSIICFKYNYYNFNQVNHVHVLNKLTVVIVMELCP